MNEFINAITNLPAIVQGALGSGLFALSLWLGQKAIRKIFESYSHHSKRSRKSWLVSERLRHEAILSPDDNTFTSKVVVLLFRSLRHVVRALMWLAMGLTFQSIFAFSGVIGFIVCIFYLMRAYEVVRPDDMECDNQAELGKIIAELSAADKT